MNRQMRGDFVDGVAGPHFEMNDRLSAFANPILFGYLLVSTVLVQHCFDVGYPEKT